MEKLRVSLIQSHLEWENPAANRDQLAEKVDRLKDRTDLIILPEMFTTGFTMAADRLAEPMDGPTMNWLARRAKQTGAVITGSFIARAEDHCYNRLVWMHPDGSFEFYDKRHLFTLAGEQNYYSPGQRRLVVELRGWRVCPLVCYDLRFPVWSRNTAGYHLLLYVANWPERRAHAWRSLLCARAIENQAYTVGLNRIGTDGNDVYYSGDSSLFDYAGQCLYRAAHLEDVFTAHLAWEPMEQFRKKYRFLPDRDVFDLPGIE